MYMSTQMDHVKTTGNRMQSPVMAFISVKVTNCECVSSVIHHHRCFFSTLIWTIQLLSTELMFTSRNTSAPVIGPATNNRGEIQAATKAISLAASVGISKLCINADSKFVIQAVTEWISNWKKRNWRLVSGKPVKNETDFKQLDHVITSNPQMTIIWKHVPAHVGIHGNERADELAKHGATMYRRKD